MESYDCVIPLVGPVVIIVPGIVITLEAGREAGSGDSDSLGLTLVEVVL